MITESEDLGRTILDSKPGGIDPDTRPFLAVVIGSDAGKRFSLDRREVTIGRCSKADIVLNDNRISRVHCAIVANGGVFQIVDRDSRNGTFVDGRRVETKLLTASSHVQIGQSVLHIEFRNLSDMEMEEDLVRQASCDPLTGIFNRSCFEKKATEELEKARRKCSAVSVVMMDLDGFKLINDTQGHLAGDYVLRLVAEIVQRHTREEDLLARYGGDELVVLIRGQIDVTGARHFCERVRAAIEQTQFAFSGESFPVTVSMGLCFADGFNLRALDEMIGHADKALYRAKDNGRNRTECETTSG